MKNFFRFDIVVDYIKENKLLKGEFCKLCNISLSEFEKMQTGDNSFLFESLCKIASVMDIDLLNFFLPLPIPSDYK